MIWLIKVGVINEFKLILKMKILKFVFWCVFFIVYNWLIMLEMFGFNNLVLMIISVIEINSVLILNGVDKMMWFNMMKILLIKMVLWLF